MKNRIVLKKDGYAIPEKDVHTEYVQAIADLIEEYFSKKKILPEKRGSLFVCKVLPFPALTKFLKEDKKLLKWDEYVGIGGSAGLVQDGDMTSYKTLLQKVVNPILFKGLKQADLDKHEKKLIEIDDVSSSDDVKYMLENLLEKKSSHDLSAAIKSMDIDGKNRTILLINWNKYGVKSGFYDSEGSGSSFYYF